MRHEQPARWITERLGDTAEVTEAQLLTRQVIDYRTRPLSRRGSGGRIPGKYHPQLVALA